MIRFLSVLVIKRTRVVHFGSSIELHYKLVTRYISSISRNMLRSLARWRRKYVVLKQYIPLLKEVMSTIRCLDVPAKNIYKKTPVLAP
jgi:hypothetical protein